ncbi:MAG: hypothetical protein JNK47_15845 [Mesorhizobium sp.]|nr:hypothetical protein [Mesorhizobium sp.]MBL8578695.1 hypothetical protein [Mesorhizobium sp.]
MAEAKKSTEIGLGKAALICNMPAKERLAFIAEGLPILFESARGLAAAAQALQAFPREAEILERQCSEECAKMLILVDLIRCPPKKVAARVGSMMKWFYDHLARLIYAEAQDWRPMTAAQLQEYIDDQRQSHYLEGDYGEYVMENWALFQRESALYADVFADENGTGSWYGPSQDRVRFAGFLPSCFRVVDALEAFGVLSREGLKILGEVWGEYDVAGEVEWRLTRDLYSPLVKRLTQAGLITERASEEHARAMGDTWQLPMYNMDFAKISVSLETLRERQDALYPYGG